MPRYTGPSLFYIAGKAYRIGGGMVSVIMPESAWQREQAARRRQDRPSLVLSARV